jgi:DNA-binding CsgD family transcriptional regulator
MRASARHLLSMVRLSGGLGTALDNHAMLVEEAGRVRDLDPALSAALYADAGICATVAGDCRLALEAGERAAAVLPEDASPSTRCQVYAMLGAGLAWAGRNAEARATLNRAGALLRHVDPLSPAAQSISFALHARLATGQEQTLFDEARALARAASDGGSSGLLPYYELLTSDSAFRLGDWATAQREADAAVAIADHSGQLGPLSIALVIRGRVAAGRGDLDLARRSMQRALEVARPRGYGATAVWAHAAVGFVELSLGHTDAAIAELEEAGRLAGMAGLEDTAVVPWRSDLVEALVQAGFHERAEHEGADLSRRAEAIGGPLQLALAARCAGLTAPDDDFDSHFDRALELHGRTDVPLDRARTLLCYGSRLHRARRRIDARERLREALAEFERLGAEPWAERARAELRASGAINRPTTCDDNELTAQEARVALGVARGSTNREIAAELFLSPKTVEFHLGRVFRKLGIRSRTELAVLVAEGRAGVPEDELEDAGV